MMVKFRFFKCNNFQFIQQDPRLMFREGTQGGGRFIVLNQASAQSSG